MNEELKQLVTEGKELGITLNVENYDSIKKDLSEIHGVDLDNELVAIYKREIAQATLNESMKQIRADMPRLQELEGLGLIK